MKRARNRSLGIVLILGALLVQSAWAGPHDLLVIRPGGPAASDEAQAQVGRLIAEIAQKAGWPAGSATAHYFNREADGLAAIEADRPGFVLTTPGFYLKHGAELSLTPINRVQIDGKTAQSYYVVALKTGPASLDDLKGRTLAGAPLTEPEFVERIVLGGRFAFGTDLTATAMPGLRALKKLVKGEVDAVAVDATEYKALASLPFAGDLATIYTSDPVPSTGLMALGGVATEADVKALAEATASFCDDGESKAVCRTYGIEGFVPASAETYKAMADAYGREDR